MFKDNPTWQMLEKSKQDLKQLLNDIYKSMQDIPSFMRHEVEASADQIHHQHNEIVKMQLELEDKLCQDSSQL